MNHWGDAPGNVWYSEVIGKGTPTINSVIARNSNIVEGAGNQLNNRIYGFHAAATGGITPLVQRYNKAGTAEKGIVEGRMRTYTYQVLRPYSTKYQGNEGFRNNND